MADRQLEQETVDAETAFGRFTELAQKLLGVSKTDTDEKLAREKDERPSTNQPVKRCAK